MIALETNISAGHNRRGRGLSWFAGTLQYQRSACDEQYLAERRPWRCIRMISCYIHVFLFILFYCILYYRVFGFGRIFCTSTVVYLTSWGPGYRRSWRHCESIDLSLFVIKSSQRPSLLSFLLKLKKWCKICLSAVSLSARQQRTVLF